MKFYPDTRGKFTSIEELNEQMISNWNSLIKYDDDVYYLGDLSIQSYVTRSTKNIAECLKQDRFIPMLNLHTNRRPYKIIWSINYARKFNRTLKLMVFRPPSKFKAKVSDKIVEEHNKYKMAKPMFTLRNLKKIKV